MTRKRWIQIAILAVQIGLLFFIPEIYRTGISLFVLIAIFVAIPICMFAVGRMR